MKKYAALIVKKHSTFFDYATENKNHYVCVFLNSENILNAMNEAEKLFNENVYFIRIMENVGKNENTSGLRKAKYNEILCNRGEGWHVCSLKRGEHAIQWECETNNKYINWSIVKHILIPTDQ